MKPLPGGGFTIADSIAIDGEGLAPFVIGAGWLLEIISMKSGEFYFVRDDEEIRPCSKRFGIFYSPFSIVRMGASRIRGDLIGVGAIKSIPGLPILPLVFDTDFDGPITAATDAVRILESAPDKRFIELTSKPSLLSIKAKRIIDENYHVYPSIARVASRLNVSHEHLSRQFKRDYEMTPSNYLHRLRMAEATYKLMKGEKIIDVSAAVGYNDLSRFYKQFHKSTKTSPGHCRVR